MPLAEHHKYMSAQISKKHKFAMGGVFRAELNELSPASFLKEGHYVTPVRIEKIILATYTQEVLGEKRRYSRIFTTRSLPLSFKTIQVPYVIRRAIGD